MLMRFDRNAARSALARRPVLSLGVLLGVLSGVPALAACSGKGGAGRTSPPSGMNTTSQARRYVDKAVRRSSEGVILMPSKKAETLYDRTRLNEIAQNLRVPAAMCFVGRAVETMKLGQRDGETTYVDVPEGQIRIRARINPSGEVLRTEVLETGFKDEAMYPCLDKAIRAVKWTQNRTGMVQFIDVIYWVSLGFSAEDHTAEARLELRKQTAIAALRARQCLEGRVPAGRYEVTGLSLVDREGRTLANRVDAGVLPERVTDCVSVVFREIRMPRVKEAFVRPISPKADFVVATDGSVSFADEKWLALIQLEEETLKAERRGESDDTSTEIDEGEPPVATAPGTDTPTTTPTTPPPGTPGRADPATGGQKLKLGGLRNDPR
ncbi:MAG: hypothetical protein H0T76_02140 [Nannocystis sp.]|nr:hypothetical protein [Nannocystis sp.]MBA3545262.1 hypothetical protein [Nannocystis sp.]